MPNRLAVFIRAGSRTASSTRLSKTAYDVIRPRHPRTQSARAAWHWGGKSVWSRQRRSSALQAATQRGSGGGGGGGGGFTRPHSIKISTRRFWAGVPVGRGLVLPLLSRDQVIRW